MKKLLENLKIAEQHLGLEPGTWTIGFVRSETKSWKEYGLTLKVNRIQDKIRYGVSFNRWGEMRIEKEWLGTWNMSTNRIEVKGVKKIHEILNFLTEQTDTQIIKTIKEEL